MMGYPIPGGQHLILMYASKTKEIHQAIHMNVHTHTCIYVRYTCVCITILIKKIRVCEFERGWGGGTPEELEEEEEG